LEGGKTCGRGERRSYKGFMRQQKKHGFKNRQPGRAKNPRVPWKGSKEMPAKGKKVSKGAPEKMSHSLSSRGQPAICWRRQLSKNRSEKLGKALKKEKKGDESYQFVALVAFHSGPGGRGRQIVWALAK